MKVLTAVHQREYQRTQSGVANGWCKRLSRAVPERSPFLVDQCVHDSQSGQWELCDLAVIAAINSTETNYPATGPDAFSVRRDDTRERRLLNAMFSPASDGDAYSRAH